MHGGVQPQVDTFSPWTQCSVTLGGAASGGVIMVRNEPPAGPRQSLQHRVRRLSPGR